MKILEIDGEKIVGSKNMFGLISKLSDGPDLPDLDEKLRAAEDTPCDSYPGLLEEGVVFGTVVYGNAPAWAMLREAVRTSFPNDQDSIPKWVDEACEIEDHMLSARRLDDMYKAVAGKPAKEAFSQLLGKNSARSVLKAIKVSTQELLQFLPDSLQRIMQDNESEVVASEEFFTLLCRFLPAQMDDIMAFYFKQKAYYIDSEEDKAVYTAPFLGRSKETVPVSANSHGWLIAYGLAVATNAPREEIDKIDNIHTESINRELEQLLGYRPF